MKPIELMNEKIAQRDVFEKALGIHAERSEAYGDAWRQYGAVRNILQVAAKTDRLMAVWYHELMAGRLPDLAHKDALDDAYDAMNFLAFFIRSVHEGNITGSAPQRPNVVPLMTGEGEVVRLVDLSSGAVRERKPECVEAWPGCVNGEYDPRCCRFPKSCSC